jgi:hypothetical protein
MLEMCLIHSGCSKTCFNQISESNKWSKFLLYAQKCKDSSELKVLSFILNVFIIQAP